MDFILREGPCFFSEEYAINWFLEKFCTCRKKIVLLEQKSNIHEILLIRIIYLGRRLTVLS